MLVKRYQLFLIALILAFGVSLIAPPAALAQTPDGVTQINNFITSIIKVVASVAGLVATGFFVVGGLGYMTSSGNPIALERSKRTILFAGVGLAITIGAFALSGIIGDLARNAFGG